MRPATTALDDYLAPIGSPDYYLVRLLPGPVRPAAGALLSIEREWLSLLTRPGDPGVLRLRLFWWQQALADDHPPGTRHPLLHCLEASERLPAGHVAARLRRAHAALCARLDWPSGPSTSELWRSLRAAEGELGHLLVELTAGRVLAEHAATVDFASTLAWLRCLDYARDLSRRGQTWLPFELTQAHGLDSHALLSAPRGPDWTALAQAYLALGVVEAERSRAQLPRSHYRASLGLRIRALQTVARLQAARRGGYAVFHEAVSLTPIHNLLLALAVAALGWRADFHRLTA